MSVSVSAISMFIMMAPMTQGMGPIAPGANTDRSEIMPSTTAIQNPILLAENEETTAGDNAQGAPGTNDPSAKSESDPLKPFNPSEEIAAEQAVDFPVDI